MRKSLIKGMVLVLAAMGSGSLQAGAILTDLSIHKYEGFQVDNPKTGEIRGDDVYSFGDGNEWLGVFAGMFRMRIDGQGWDGIGASDVFWDDNEDFNAFCIQTSELIASQGVIGGHSLWSLKDYLESPIHDSDSHWVDTTFSRISALFSLTDMVEGHQGTVVLGDDAETDAAFQLALWGIINGDDFDYKEFDVEANHGLIGSWDPGNQAVSRLDFYVLSSNNSQDLLVWKTATEVPLPATLWLMLAGILGVGLARRYELSSDLVYGGRK
ncbi:MULTISPECIES: VPLPA-CTERM sorting domain-containing protein [unclassified Ectothiorhodospira]|uniref:VPLPA-CTERM sorting domain-containing protein n=1 Tax=unclassified Ectothiorhodospira TaxID=2684909 RepID=UPI001EE99E4D|nr:MULTISPECIES: VPLPA-CTERM sorting domain-containing protein [unclassified Ectothiorhodospira]MCG5517325.1 VPLPA-CTERM sorting domain-containing protein [Ectothiorhodospira sp. 9100]MCG5520020.1 VPLPA-CTERM sorting domain-containing protein [Ectothiorhodospira sp. 9905]